MKKYMQAFLLLLIFTTASYAEDNQIGIKDHLFTPSTLTIDAGTKVTWVNHDQDPHTVVDSSSKHAFRSAALDTEDSYSYVFTGSGTYTYFCTMHPMMTGKIIVTDNK